ncbi:hypothetical protein GCM10008939_30860 [Deinococcus aquiradiocola]|uniref:Uncharacterized protein n=1 Tax=Deinococcus aquiradiocola TaxID=393059 RepID=A0A917PML0_9DEIO|nr:hypothetical protein GCM10008939_30860 [Deinococcus aquiradiocola]
MACTQDRAGHAWAGGTLASAYGEGLKVFVVMLAGFVTLVGVFVAVFAFQGREVRVYGQAVLAAVRVPPAVPVACSRVAPGVRVPAQVAECRVRTSGGRAEVDLRLDGGRSFLLRR